MIKGMTEKEAGDFIERVSATAIANQAILKCHLGGLPVTVDNVILLVGDFFDPSTPELEVLVANIERAIEDVIETSRILAEKLKDQKSGNVHLFNPKRSH